jgi:hypothetical protein
LFHVVFDDFEQDFEEWELNEIFLDEEWIERGSTPLFISLIMHMHICPTTFIILSKWLHK